MVELFLLKNSFVILNHRVYGYTEAHKNAENDNDDADKTKRRAFDKMRDKGTNSKQGNAPPDDDCSQPDCLPEGELIFFRNTAAVIGMHRVYFSFAVKYSKDDTQNAHKNCEN